MAAKRTKSIIIRVSPDEYEILQQKASEAGLTVSAFLRDHTSRVRISNEKVKARWLQILAAVNNNLNALMEIAGLHQTADAAIIIAYAAAIHRHVKKVGQAHAT